MDKYYIIIDLLLMFSCLVLFHFLHFSFQVFHPKKLKIIQDARF